MCQEVLQMVCKMDKSLELQVVLSCAPVITGRKISNLLTIEKGQESAFHKLFQKSGLQYFRLSQNEKQETYLVFRNRELVQYLSERANTGFLKAEGYCDFTLGKILRQFHERYEAYRKGQSACFPHEMGILLGYPVEDVRGFMEHDGKDYLFSGYWKVYSDVNRKMEIFASYEEAKEELVQMIAAGYDLSAILEIYNARQQKAAV